MKKFLSVLLILVMAMTMLAGCGKKEADAPAATDVPKATEAPKTTDASKSTDAPATTETPAVSDKYSEFLTIDVYDVAANYQGIQPGWFAKVVKDKFNMELNIIAPQVAGDAIFQTRSATGNLGDIVLLEKIQFSECVENGLIKDITNELKATEHLYKDFQKQIDTANAAIPSNTTNSLYEIPVEMTNTSPTSFSEDNIYSSPTLRWDLYKGIGSPDIENLDGLADTLEAMVKKYPTNAAGDPCYAVSLWPDWDNGDTMLGIANVVQLTTWYGEKIRESIIRKPDDTFIEVLDKSGSYYKILKFLNELNKRGLVDPDSGTQTWDDASAKMSAGQVYMFWYSWQEGFWSDIAKKQNGTAMIFIPVKDQIYYTESDSYYGTGRMIGVGSQVEGEKYQRIMDFLDWYGSPEGAQTLHDGILGFNYEVAADGRLAVLNDKAFSENLPVPEEWGGAGYKDGMSQINQWILHSMCINPNTNEPYKTQYWSTYKEATMTQMKEEWKARFGSAEPVQWMKDNNKLIVNPSIGITLDADTTDISLIRNQCRESIKTYSWQCIFAEDDAEFEALWDAMDSEMRGLGYDELVAWDLNVFGKELEALKAAR